MQWKTGANAAKIENTNRASQKCQKTCTSLAASPSSPNLQKTEVHATAGWAGWVGSSSGSVSNPSALHTSRITTRSNLVPRSLEGTLPDWPLLTARGRGLLGHAVETLSATTPLDRRLVVGRGKRDGCAATSNVGGLLPRFATTHAFRSRSGQELPHLVTKPRRPPLSTQCTAPGGTPLYSSPRRFRNHLPISFARAVSLEAASMWHTWSLQKSRGSAARAQHAGPAGTRFESRMEH